MKNYEIYFTDAPWDAYKVQAANRSEARKAGLLYIKQWQLEAEIQEIVEVI